MSNMNTRVDLFFRYSHFFAWAVWSVEQVDTHSRDIWQSSVINLAEMDSQITLSNVSVCKLLKTETKAEYYTYK